MPLSLQRRPRPLSNSKTRSGDNLEDEATEEVLAVEGARQEVNTVFLAQLEAHLKEEAHNKVLKEEVIQGEERSKKTPFVFTAIKSFTNKKNADLE